MWHIALRTAPTQNAHMPPSNDSVLFEDALARRRHDLAVERHAEPQDGAVGVAEVCRDLIERALVTPFAGGWPPTG